MGTPLGVEKPTDERLNTVVRHTLNVSTLKFATRSHMIILKSYVSMSVQLVTLFENILMKITLPPRVMWIAGTRPPCKAKMNMSDCAVGRVLTGRHCLVDSRGSRSDAGGMYYVFTTRLRAEVPIRTPVHITESCRRLSFAGL